MTRPFIGVLPAAGKAERLQPLPVAKELLPIGFVTDEASGQTRPVPIAEHAVRAMAEAGVRRCLLVIADHKMEVMKYFGDGSRFNVSLAYVDQEQPTGLAAAVDQGYPWLREANVCLALPDTIFAPRSALGGVCDLLTRSGADLVLGVFPTQTPEQLAPVRIDGADRVLEVMEKPTTSAVQNTWGIAAWTPRFTEFLHDSMREMSGKSISLVFNAAISAGFDVRALGFDGGDYFDIGTVESLTALVISSRLRV